jgi:uncharacterized membrane protein
MSEGVLAMDRLTGPGCTDGMTGETILVTAVHLAYAPDVALAGTALGSGLVAGAFLVFSVLVMPALAVLPTADGVRAMQSVNRVAVRPLFMTLLFGTGVVSLLLGALELAGGARPAVLAAATLYLVGVLGVTVAGNVPLNEALARSPAGAEPPGGWTRWLRRWTVWNTVRSLAALVGAILSAAALAG